LYNILIVFGIPIRQVKANKNVFERNLWQSPGLTYFLLRTV